MEHSLAASQRKNTNSVSMKKIIIWAGLPLERMLKKMYVTTAFPTRKIPVKFAGRIGMHGPPSSAENTKKIRLPPAGKKHMSKKFQGRAGYWIAILIFLSASCAKPEPVSFAGYRNLRFTNEGFTTGIVRLDVAFYNPNPFPMKIKETALAVSIDDKPFGQITQDSISQMPARDTFLMPVSFKVNLIDLAARILDRSRGDSILLEASGHCKIGKSGVYMNLPLHYRSKELLRMF